MRLLQLILLLVICTSISFGQNEDYNIIKIGLLVSEDPAKDSISLSAVHGAEVAISLMDVEVQLVVRSCDGPWGVTSKQMVDFVYEDEVDAIITSVDGRNAHLAEQVATKAQKILISARATDPTLTQAFVPWFFRITPDDKKQAQALKEEIFSEQKLDHVTVIHPSNYNGSYAMDHFIKALEDGQRSNTQIISYDPLTFNFYKTLENLKETRSQGFVFLGSSEHTSQLIKKVSREYPGIRLFGNQSTIESGETLVTLPDSMWVTSSSGWPSPQGNSFIERFSERYKYPPGMVAAHAHDALTILVNAIQLSGSDHDQLQKQLKQINHSGITGTIEFDKHGNRLTDCSVGYLKDGKLIMGEL